MSQSARSVRATRPRALMLNFMLSAFLCVDMRRRVEAARHRVLDADAARAQSGVFVRAVAERQPVGGRRVSCGLNAAERQGRRRAVRRRLCHAARCLGHVPAEERADNEQDLSLRMHISVMQHAAPHAPLRLTLNMRVDTLRTLKLQLQPHLYTRAAALRRSASLEIWPARLHCNLPPRNIVARVSRNDSTHAQSFVHKLTPVPGRTKF